MRCGICPVTFCQHRRTDGDCCLPWGKELEPDVFTTPDTRPWEGVNRPGITVHPIAIMSAAQDLVDAVEKYTRQECLRSELMIKKDKLKELIKDK